MVKVSRVEENSVAAELGILPGTELIAVNGRPVSDFLDWEFLTADEELVIDARQPDGEELEFDIERPLEEPMGLGLEPPRIRRCANRCDFCFVDGLPDGLRDVLYIRDDDYRLSFRYGNFATLTNLKPRDIERIIEYRLSPLYVSVHATDPTVRRYLLRNPTAPEILTQLREFADHGIQFHTQVVMSPGVNDGAVLEQTLRERGAHWAFGADELYLRAGVELPPAEIYDSFDQVENGVGSVRWLQRRIAEGMEALHGWQGRRIGVVTGTAMGALMPMVLEPLARVTGAHFELITVVNSLFGPSVTTAGLLPGTALQAVLAGRGDLDLALLPGESINDDGLFMDSMSLALLSAAVPMELRLSKDFVDALHEPVAA